MNFYFISWITFYNNQLIAYTQFLKETFLYLNELYFNTYLLITPYLSKYIVLLTILDLDYYSLYNCTICLSTTVLKCSYI